MEIPADVRMALCLTDEELEREVFLMTDWYTDELFGLPGSEAVTVRFPVSRLVLDPERLLDDSREPMAARGMGLIYTRTSSGAILRNDPTPFERAKLIDRFYDPHHTALSDTVDLALKTDGACLIIDCHSFPSGPFPYKQDQRPERPDFCLGKDSFHTPNWLVDITRNLICSHGFKAGINQPSSGALVPTKHLGRERSVLTIMIRLNRKIYMNEMTGERLPGFSKAAAAMQNTVRKLGHAFSSLMTAFR
jgi:N-formylglutamate deformylase